MYRIIFFIAILLLPFAVFAGPGYRVIYDITIVEKVKANYQQLAAGRPDTSKMPVSFSNSFDNNYRFTLSLTVISEEADHTLMQGNISMKSISLKQDGQEDQRRMDITKQASKQSFYFKVKNNGSIYAIQTGDNNASFTNFLRDLLSQLQIVQPTNGVDGTKWTSDQEYPDGVYRVQYERAGNLLNKTIQGNSSDSVIAFDNKVSRSDMNGLADKISFEKKFYQKLGTSVLAYVERNMQAIVIDTQQMQAFSSSYAAEASRWPAANIYNPVSEERRKVLVSQGVLRKDTYETLMAKLPSAETMENEELNSLVSKFRSLLFLQPQHMPAILDRLLQTHPDSISFSILSTALIEVDAEPAQNALATLLEKYSNNAQVLQRILPALGLRKFLSANMEKTLFALRLNNEDPMIATSAGLTLSNLSRYMAGQQPARADSIMHRLVNDYMNGEKNDIAISRFLNETGNAGYDKAMEENKKFVSHEDVDIRLRAWYSLRLFKNTSIDTLLASGLISDTTAAVQNRILTLIHMRPVTETYKNAIIYLLKTSTNNQNIDIAIIWLAQYVKNHSWELAPIRAQLVLKVQEKFNQRLAKTP